MRDDRRNPERRGSPSVVMEARWRTLPLPPLRYQMLLLILFETGGVPAGHGSSGWRSRLSREAELEAPELDEDGDPHSLRSPEAPDSD